MRDKDTVILESLYGKIIQEKFFSYDPPSDKRTLMYDFYVLNYLQFLLNLQSRGFRDLPEDIVDSVKDAANKLYPYLKTELLDAVFYSICAEFRHFPDHGVNYERIENMYGDNENIIKFFNLYDRYRKFYKKGSKEQEELVKVFGVEKPSAKQRPSELEKKEGLADRVTSYKAVNYALEQLGLSRSFFVKLARDCYVKLSWDSSYGGDAWCGICKGWLLLHYAEKMESVSVVSTKVPEAEVKGRGEEPEYYKQKSERSKKETSTETKELDIPAAIDHIYDLQHNTDTVFNKLRSYYQGGYGWIEQALTDKANVKSYFELLKKTSGTVRALAPRVLYNKLGETWESYTKNKSPNSSNTFTKIKSKEKKCGDISGYTEKKKQPDKDPSDLSNFPNEKYITAEDLKSIFNKKEENQMYQKILLPDDYYLEIYQAQAGDPQHFNISLLSPPEQTEFAKITYSKNTSFTWLKNWINQKIEKDIADEIKLDTSELLSVQKFNDFLDKNYKTIGATLPIGEFVIKIVNVAAGSIGLAVEKENEPYSEGGKSLQNHIDLPIAPKDISRYVEKVNKFIKFIKNNTESKGFYGEEPLKQTPQYITGDEVYYVLKNVPKNQNYKLKSGYVAFVQKKYVESIGYSIDHVFVMKAGGDIVADNPIATKGLTILSQKIADKLNKKIENKEYSSYLDKLSKSEDVKSVNYIIEDELQSLYNQTNWPDFKKSGKTQSHELTDDYSMYIRKSEDTPDLMDAVILKNKNIIGIVKDINLYSKEKNVKMINSLINTYENQRSEGTNDKPEPKDQEDYSFQITEVLNKIFTDQNKKVKHEKVELPIEKNPLQLHVFSKPPDRYYHGSLTFVLSAPNGPVTDINPKITLPENMFLQHSYQDAVLKINNWINRTVSGKKSEEKAIDNFEKKLMTPSKMIEMLNELIYTNVPSVGVHVLDKKYIVYCHIDQKPRDPQWMGHHLVVTSIKNAETDEELLPKHKASTKVLAGNVESYGKIISDWVNGIIKKDYLSI